MNELKMTRVSSSVSTDAERLAQPVRRKVAMAAAAGSAALAAFQLALALGAPLGRAAWGGANPQLSTGLRVASAVTCGIWLLAALVVLRRAGVRVVPLPAVVVRWGIWVLAALFALGGLLNLASSSVWERFLWGPFGLIMAVLYIIVARRDGAKS
jgi:hypothetical protein